MLVICQMFHLRFLGNWINFLYNYNLVYLLVRDAFSAFLYSGKVWIY